MPIASPDVAAAGRTILSVDTSMPMLSVSLTTGEHLLGGITLTGRESRNEKLLPAVDWLLTEAGVARNGLDLLVVTRGPGSFTGVRVGLATIQGLSVALGIPMCAMSTHEAFAESVHGEASSVLLHGDAGRGELYVSAFMGEQEVFAPSLMNRQDVEALHGQFEAILDIDARLESVNVAALAAKRAARLCASEIPDRYAAATPIYVRLAEAEVKLQQKADERAGKS